MSTAKSPDHIIRAQALKIALTLKQPGSMARPKKRIKFGVAMDDKLLTLDMAWAEIDRSTVRQLQDLVYNQMKRDLSNEH